MKLSFRWFGPQDPVKLNHIRQIPGVSHIVTQVPPDAVGEVISAEKVEDYIREIQKNEMDFKVFESLALHPSIKLGDPGREKYIENFKANIRLLAKKGIEIIVYSFRPIFRWGRTEGLKQIADGSYVSVFDQSQAHRLDPFIHKGDESPWHKENSRIIYKQVLTTDQVFPGYYTTESIEVLKSLRSRYQQLGREGIWKNLDHFLMEIIPVAEECGVKMALHPDDPPWDIFGVPRMMGSEAALDRLIQCYDSPANGIAFCSGTLGSRHNTDVVKMADKYLKLGRIPFAHIRNVKTTETSMEECAHYSPCGNIDMVELLRVFSKHNFQGYIRPDHGRMIWQEEGTPSNGIYDRALGAQYILGIWECLEKGKNR